MKSGRSEEKVLETIRAILHTQNQETIAKNLAISCIVSISQDFVESRTSKNWIRYLVEYCTQAAKSTWFLTTSSKNKESERNNLNIKFIIKREENGQVLKNSQA